MTKATKAISETDILMAAFHRVKAEEGVNDVFKNLACAILCNALIRAVGVEVTQRVPAAVYAS